MSVKGIRRMLVGEKMPDKNDPKYKERYEKEIAAGRKFADANIKKLAKQDSEYSDIYKQYLALTEEKKKLSAKASELTAALTQLVVNKYIELNDDEEKVKTTVVDKKWLAALVSSFNEEQTNAVLAIINEVKTLADRYADTLPDIEQQEQTLESEVSDCLKQMGYEM